jgi:ABC-type multidrug transport system ATPase subunit
MSDGGEPLLVFEDVALVIGGARLLDSVSFTLGAGERIAITGESGIGKSMVLRLAAGLLLPGSGSIRLFGRALSALDPDALRGVRARCGLALQGGSLLGALSVEDNLRLGFGEGRIARSDRAQRRIDRMLVDFDLGHLATRPAGSLSVGEQRRVELARVFVRDPELVILDEPFERSHAAAATLEQRVGRQTVSRGRALLLATQDDALGARLADRCFRLHHGRLVQQARAESLPLAMS